MATTTISKSYSHTRGRFLCFFSAGGASENFIVLAPPVAERGFDISVVLQGTAGGFELDVSGRTFAGLLKDLAFPTDEVLDDDSGLDCTTLPDDKIPSGVTTFLTENSLLCF
ncbi:MAG: hypothetical protein HWD59_10815 [Coxiellaceae bacterium]|nr:MAG: hypothetical protein HWD59_10815 [Coxiellaceae bacterium]